jgi:hypothetical protein
MVYIATINYIGTVNHLQQVAAIGTCWCIKGVSNSASGKRYRVGTYCLKAIAVSYRDVV